MILRQVRINWGGGPSGGGGVSTLHFDASLSTVFTEQGTEAIMNGWANFAGTSFTSSWDGSWREIDSATGQVIGAGSTGAHNAPGEVAGQVLANQTQWCISLRTGLFVGGRELRGRCYLPGPTVVHSSEGEPTADALTGLQGAFETARSGGLSVFSPTHLAAERVQTVVPFTEWAVQRSRRD